MLIILMIVIINIIDKSILIFKKDDCSMLKNIITIKIFSILLFMFNIVNADDIKEADLGTSVVSASGFEQTIKDAPASITVVGKEQLEEKPFRDLAEAISDVPGVNIDQNVGKTGGYGISIRGMPPDHTLILMDGKRQNVSGDTFPNGFTEVNNSFMPPLSAIESIEVIRGPMSTIYGSDATGGVVNVRLKKAFDKWATSLVLSTTIQEKKYFGNTYGINLYSAGPIDEAKKWSLVIRGNELYRQRVPLSSLKVIPTTKGDLNAIGRSNIVGLSQANISNLGTRVGYSPNSADFFYIDFDHGLQWYDNRDSLLGTATVPGGYDKHLYFVRNNVIIAHEGKYNGFSSNTSMQYNSTLNRGRIITNSLYPTRGGEERMTLGQDFLADHKNVFYVSDILNLTFGGGYMMTSIRDKLFPGAGSLLWQHKLNAYVENESSLSDRVLLTLGFREDFNSVYGFNSSPRAYVVYNALDRDSTIGALVVKGGIGTGYKTPNVSQLVNTVVNATRQGRALVFGNSKLQPESSVNYEIGIINETNYTTLGVTIFYTKFNDKISNVSTNVNGVMPNGLTCPSTPNNPCSTPINVDTAQAFGIENSLRLKPINVGSGNIGANIAYTWMRTEQTSGVSNGQPLTAIPEHNLNFDIHYDFIGFSMYLKGEYKANISRGFTPWQLHYNPGKKFYKPYELVHLGFGYRFNESYKLNFGIYNLFDKNFIDYSLNKTNTGVNEGSYSNNYNYVREGRRYFISLNMDF